MKQEETQQNNKESWAILVTAMGSKWLKRIIVSMGVIATIFIIALMILTTIDVVLRYILGTPFKGAYEISELLFLSAVFLGMAYTQLFHEHVNVDLLISHFPERFNLIVESFMLLLAMIIYGLLFWKGMGALVNAISSGEYRWGLIRIPLWPAKLTVPLGALLLCLRLIEEIVNNLYKIFHKKREMR